MNDNLSIPFIDAYWVVPGKLMAGEYPGAYYEENTRKRVVAMIQAGIRSIIDLTQPGDSNHPYANFWMEEAALYGIVVKRWNFPIPDFGTPPAGLMSRILAQIDLEMAQGKLVYVHCMAGLGRTGTVIGCYLVNQGLSGDDALVEIARLRSNTSSWFRHSPENSDQVQFILSWAAEKEQDQENFNNMD